MKRTKAAILFMLLVAVIVPAQQGAHPVFKGSPNYQQWRTWSQVERETFVSGMMHMGEKIHLFTRLMERPESEYVRLYDLSHMTVREVVNAINMYYEAADISEGREHTIAFIFLTLGMIREVMSEQQKGRP